MYIATRRARLEAREAGFLVINKSGDKKTVRSRVEDSAVDYWAFLDLFTEQSKTSLTDSAQIWLDQLKIGSTLLGLP